MSKPPESPFLHLCYRCFMSPRSSHVFSFLTFSILLLPVHLLIQLISITNSLLSSSFLRLRHSEPYSNMSATRARYQGAIEFHLGSNGDALFSPHFSESPECCTCQAYSPLDILLTSSTVISLRYKPSQIENLWMKTKCKL